MVCLRSNHSKDGAAGLQVGRGSGQFQSAFCPENATNPFCENGHFPAEISFRISTVLPVVSNQLALLLINEILEKCSSHKGSTFCNLMLPGEPSSVLMEPLNRATTHLKRLGQILQTCIGYPCGITILFLKFWTPSPKWRLLYLLAPTCLLKLIFHTCSYYTDPFTPASRRSLSHVFIQNTLFA